MSGLREDYIEVHKQDAFLALAALDVLIEKGTLNGKSMSDEKLTRERIKAAVDARWRQLLQHSRLLAVVYLVTTLSIKQGEGFER